MVSFRVWRNASQIPTPGKWHSRSDTWHLSACKSSPLCHLPALVGLVSLWSAFEVHASFTEPFAATRDFGTRSVVHSDVQWICLYHLYKLRPWKPLILWSIHYLLLFTFLCFDCCRHHIRRLHLRISNCSAFKVGPAVISRLAHVRRNQLHLHAMDSSRITTYLPPCSLIQP